MLPRRYLGVLAGPTLIAGRRCEFPACTRRRKACALRANMSQSFSLTLLIACLAVFLATVGVGCAPAALDDGVYHRRPGGGCSFLYEMLTTNDQTCRRGVAAPRVRVRPGLTLALLPPISSRATTSTTRSSSRTSAASSRSLAGTLIAGVTAFSLYWARRAAGADADGVAGCCAHLGGRPGGDVHFLVDGRRPEAERAHLRRVGAQRRGGDRAQDARRGVSTNLGIEAGRR